MAKAKKPLRNGNSNDIPVRDYSLFYSDLSFLPSDIKESKLWLAQQLFNMKMNGIQFVDTAKATKYRRLNVMDIDRQEYVNLIDPPTPMGGGGKATYFAADFKDTPIYIHLQNIRRAKLDRVFSENQLQVNEIDKFAKSQRQKDKDKIIYQRVIRTLINQLNEEMGGVKTGLPPITEFESVDDYIKKLNNEPLERSIDDIQILVDYIRKQIKDEHDMALYERYIYKGEIERAFELGIQHYLIDQNKWRIKSEFFNQDIINFNRACGRWYIDETTGRGNVEYIDPTTLFTSPFFQKNGDDLLYFFYEKQITFAEWLKQFGQTLTEDQIKEVLTINKTNSGIGTGAMGIDNWQNWGWQQRNNCLIRIGYASVLTQEMQKFSEEYVDNSIPMWGRKDLTWKPDKESAIVKNKAYNVWYSFYYIPPPSNRLQANLQADWSWQSNYIFNIQKDIDMYRFGVDQRYAKPTLVIYKNDVPSCTDIEEGFMPKIRTMWHKFQNCLVQDTNAVVIDWDFMMGILNATDEANNQQIQSVDNPTGGNGVNAGLEQWRMMRQGGIAFMKFRDKNGNYPPGFDPSKFFVNVDTKHLDKAEKYLTLILQQYELLKSSLAQSDITSGQAPKPRTPVEGIKATLEASKEGIWFVEKAVREFLIMYGERVVQMILNFRKETVKYGYTKRWEEFCDVVGLANALMVEGVEDLDPEHIGLTVSLEDTSFMKQYVFELANQMVANREIGREGALLAIEANKSNYKYAYALLMLEAKKHQEFQMEQEAIAHQRQMELGQQNLQIAMALQGAKTQGKQAEITTQGETDAILQQQMNQLKAQTMQQQKEQLLRNRLMENQQKSELKKGEYILEENLKQQQPFIPSGGAASS